MKLPTMLVLAAAGLNLSHLVPKGHPVMQTVLGWIIVCLIILVFLDRKPGGPAGG